MRSSRRKYGARGSLGFGGLFLMFVLQFFLLVFSIHAIFARQIAYALEANGVAHIQFHSVHDLAFAVLAGGVSIFTLHLHPPPFLPLLFASRTPRNGRSR